MANDAIIADVGAVFHRLFDHRTAMHTEHQFFVKEFEGRRGNQDMQKLQNCMGMLNEIDALFLPEIFTSKQHFRSIREQVNEIASMGDTILKKEAKYSSTKGMSKSEQAKLDQDMQEYKASLLKQKEKYMEAHKAKMNALTQELEALQLELQSLGPQKLRGSTASLTASSMAEDKVEDVSELSEAEKDPSQHEEEVNEIKDEGQHVEINEAKDESQHVETNEAKDESQHVETNEAKDESEREEASETKDENMTKVENEMNDEVKAENNIKDENEAEDTTESVVTSELTT